MTSQHLIFLIITASAIVVSANPRTASGSSDIVAKLNSNSVLPAKCEPHCHANIDYEENPMSCTSYYDCSAGTPIEFNCTDHNHPYFDNTYPPPANAYYPCTADSISCDDIDEGIIQDCNLTRCQNTCQYETQRIYDETNCHVYKKCIGFPGNFNTVTHDCATGLYFDGWECRANITTCCAHDCLRSEDIKCAAANINLSKCPDLCVPEYYHCGAAGKHPIEKTCPVGQVFNTNPDLPFCLLEEFCEIPEVVN